MKVKEAITMLRNKKETVRDIAQGWPKSTFQNIIQKKENTGVLSNHKVHGRPRKVGHNNDDKLRNTCQKQSSGSRVHQFLLSTGYFTNRTTERLHCKIQTINKLQRQDVQEQVTVS